MKYTPETAARTLLLTALILTATAWSPLAQGQPTGQDLVDGLRARLQSAGSIRADFTQTFSSEFFEDTESTSGTVILQGDRYRVETPTQVFVSDGVTTWIYDRAAGQVLINDYVEDETTVSLNRFLLGDRTEYRATAMEDVTLNGRAHYAVSLESMDPAAFFPRCEMFIRASDQQISRLEVVDLNGTMIAFELRNVTLGPPVTAETFTFKPPSSSDVVDLRSS